MCWPSASRLFVIYANGLLCCLDLVPVVLALRGGVDLHQVGLVAVRFSSEGRQGLPAALRLLMAILLGPALAVFRYRSVLAGFASMLIFQRKTRQQLS